MYSVVLFGYMKSKIIFKIWISIERGQLDWVINFNRFNSKN